MQRALVLATLFLNLYFYLVHSGILWTRGVSFESAGLALGEAMLIGLLFFAGPALAAQRSRRPLFDVATDSLGKIPSLAFRGVCVVFLLTWAAELIMLPARWLLPMILRHEVSATQIFLVAAGVLGFTFVTAIPSTGVNIRLAAFSNKLGIAILAAALIRVREGWPGILTGFPQSQEITSLDLWHDFGMLTFYVAPLAFLAAGCGWRCRRPRQVATLGLLGLVLPLFGTLVVVGAIQLAAFFSRFYQPSGQPNVALALWSHVAESALPGTMLLASLTIFGSLRFAARTVAHWGLPRSASGWMQWMILTAFVLAIAALALKGNLGERYEWPVIGLAIVSAVITADFISARWRTPSARSFDWIGALALLAGSCAAAMVTQGSGLFAPELWWHPQLFPAYAAAFGVCFAGRAGQALISLILRSSCLRTIGQA